VLYSPEHAPEPSARCSPICWPPWPRSTRVTAPPSSTSSPASSSDDRGAGTRRSPSDRTAVSGGTGRGSAYGTRLSTHAVVPGRERRAGGTRSGWS
jgi:hypothetical protein